MWKRDFNSRVKVAGSLFQIIDRKIRSQVKSMRDFLRCFFKNQERFGVIASEKQFFYFGKILRRNIEQIEVFANQGKSNGVGCDRMIEIDEEFFVVRARVFQYRSAQLCIKSGNKFLFYTCLLYTSTPSSAMQNPEVTICVVRETHCPNRSAD